ncbi:MAG: glucose-1-phosphate adenylyltransferase [Candidatus Competibacterales bacterium]|nr:glucose-1-phosphate adenylyltransferase [Candidatus Competibacterales bacterium]
MAIPKVLAIVLAGGEGSRLHPLTAERSKPAVPFGGGYRIIDFVLGNLINSQLLSIYVLVQYKSQSLIEHLDVNWQLSPVLLEHFIVEVPPQRESGDAWFQGTANAVYQNRRLICQHQPDLVAIVSADHVYRMDYRQMLSYHLDMRADVTLAVNRVPLSWASDLGVVDVNEQGRVQAFQEKPAHPPQMPGSADRTLASMGIYLFSTEILMEVLEQVEERNLHDFGHDVLPFLLDSHHRLFAYDFTENHIPGIKPHEIPAYWRDVGTIDAYWQAHQDILGPQPPFDLFNDQWPLRVGRNAGPPAKLLGQQVENCMIGSGTFSKAKVLRNSIIGRGVLLEEGVEVEDCIITDHVRIGRNARLRRTIVDRYNHIPANTVIGEDSESDRQRFHLDPSGLVIVPRGQKVDPI